MGQILCVCEKDTFLQTRSPILYVGMFENQNPFVTSQLQKPINPKTLCHLKTP